MDNGLRVWVLWGLIINHRPPPSKLQEYYGGEGAQARTNNYIVSGKARKAQQEKDDAAAAAQGACLAWFGGLMVMGGGSLDPHRAADSIGCARTPTVQAPGRTRRCPLTRVCCWVTWTRPWGR